MNKKATSHTEHKSAKREQRVSRHGRGGCRGRRGKSEPVVERNPGQLYKSRRWQSDETQKDADREPRDHREEKKALSGSRYSNIKGTDTKVDIPCSAPIIIDINERVDDESNKNDVTEIETEILPSPVEQSEKARKRRKKRRKKSSSDNRRSSLRHRRKHPFLVDDDEILIDNDNFDGDDEHGSSTDDLNIKSRARDRKKSRRSCTRRGREPQSFSTDDEENNIGTTLPRLQPLPLTQQPHQNQQLLADTRLRNIPQEYRKRAAALRTRSPTDYMMRGFSQASMRVYEFATGMCANAECAFNNARARNESCNRNTPCVTSQLPPVLARGIVSGAGCMQPATATLVDDDPGTESSLVRSRSRNRSFRLF